MRRRPRQLASSHALYEAYNGVPQRSSPGAYLVLFGISFIGSNYTLIQYVRGKASKNE